MIEDDKPRTCGYHARIMAALVPPEIMGPALKEVYERFQKDADQECIAHESQVVYLFQEAMRRDFEAGWDPAKAGTPSPAPG